MKKLLLHVREKNILHTSILLAMLIASVTVMIGTPSVMADPWTNAGTMALFDAVDNDHNVSWSTTSLPGSYPYFDVKVMVTNISDGYAACYSLEYDPTILNYSSHSFGDAFYASGKVPANYFPTVDHTNGWIKEGNHGHMNPGVGSVKTYTDPTWGLVATFTFEFIASTPTVGTAISTYINITNVSPGRTSEWWKLVGGAPDNGPFQTYTHCQFYYETVETLTHPVQGFNVTTVSNTIVSNVTLVNEGLMELRLNVTGQTGMTGFCNVAIPKALLKAEPLEAWIVTLDGAPPDSLTITENTTHTFVNFTYTLASTLHVIIKGTWVVPEFPALTILLLLMISTIAAVILGKIFRSTKRRDRIIAE